LSPLGDVEEGEPTRQKRQGVGGSVLRFRKKKGVSS